MVISFALAIALLTATFPLIMLTKIGVKTNWSEYPAAFDALSGTINAIVLALLVARLDSKLLGLPSWLICILYFYAGVQPMFVVFELHPEVYAGIKTAVLWVVFIFKIYFFLIIFYSLQTGRMFNYFFCSQILNEHVKTLKEPVADGAPELVAATANGPLPVIATVVPGEQSTEEKDQSPPVKQVREDSRAIWFKRLGVIAIFLFTASLLIYASLTEENKQLVDSFGLSEYVVSLHVLLLFIICCVIIRASYRERKFGLLPGDQARFKKPAALRFKLFPPRSAKDRKDRFQELSNRTNEQFRSFTHYFRLFWISLLFLYTAMWFSGRGQTTQSFPSEECGTGIVGAALSSEEINAIVSGHSQTTPQETTTSERAADAMRVSKPSEERAVESMLGSKPNRTAPQRNHASMRVAGSTAVSEPTQAAAKNDHTTATTPVEASQSSSGPETSEKPLPIYQMPRNVNYAFIFFVLNNVAVLILFLCFKVLFIPVDDGKFDEKHRLLRNFALLIFVLFTIFVPLLAVIIKGNGFTPSEAEKIPTILGALGGTLNAVAFALLIARLDSRIIDLPLLLVTVLYAYAGLQPLFVTFNQPSNLLKFIATSAMTAAFIFKICLVLMVPRAALRRVDRLSLVLSGCNQCR
jgi:hypothetical protein